MTNYLARWRTTYRTAARNGVTLSDTLQAFLVLRRAGLNQDSRRQAFASAGGVLEIAALSRTLMSLYPDEELKAYDRNFKNKGNRSNMVGEVRLTSTTKDFEKGEAHVTFEDDDDDHDAPGFSLNEAECNVVEQEIADSEQRLETAALAFREAKFRSNALKKARGFGPKEYTAKTTKFKRFGRKKFGGRKAYAATGDEDSAYETAFEAFDDDDSEAEIQGAALKADFRRQKQK